MSKYYCQVFGMIAGLIFISAIIGTLSISAGARINLVRNHQFSLRNKRHVTT